MKIVFNANGFGDLLVCFKALYAIKELYKDDELVLYQKGFYDLNFLENVGFIDRVVNSAEDFFEKLEQEKPDIFISMTRNSHFFKALKKLDIKKIIVFPHFKSVFSFKLTAPLFFRHKKHMSEIALKLVRAIDKKHYDKNIQKIDFTKVKDFLPQNSKLFFKILPNYEKVIGVNAFSNHSEFVGMNFFTKDWIRLALELSKSYPNFLFILLNFKDNSIQFNIPQNSNLKVFINSDEIASLVSITKKLDYLITIDTGNLHLADILQIPTLALIRKLAAYRF